MCVQYIQYSLKEKFGINAAGNWVHINYLGYSTLKCESCMHLEDTCILDSLILRYRTKTDGHAQLFQ